MQGLLSPSRLHAVPASAGCEAAATAKATARAPVIPVTKVDDTHKFPPFTGTLCITGIRLLSKEALTGRQLLKVPAGSARAIEIGARRPLLADEDAFRAAPL